MDMTINSGNSGGPVFDLRTGAAVGLVIDTVRDLGPILTQSSSGELSNENDDAPGYVQIPTGLSHGLNTRPWADSLVEGVKASLLQRFSKTAG